MQCLSAVSRRWGSGEGGGGWFEGSEGRGFACVGVPLSKERIRFSRPRGKKDAVTIESPLFGMCSRMEHLAWVLLSEIGNGGRKGKERRGKEREEREEKRKRWPLGRSLAYLIIHCKKLPPGEDCGGVRLSWKDGIPLMSGGGGQVLELAIGPVGRRRRSRLQWNGWGEDLSARTDLEKSYMMIPVEHIYHHLSWSRCFPLTHQTSHWDARGRRERGKEERDRLNLQS